MRAPTVWLLICGLIGCHVDGHYVAPDSPDDGPSSYWSARYGGTGVDKSALINGIAAASNDDLLMAGTFEGTADLGGGGGMVTSVGGSDVWVARYRADGSLIWARRFGGSANEEVYSVTCDANGNAYVSGSFSGPVDFGGGSRTTTFGAFLIKLDSQGMYQWDRAMDLSIRGRAHSITIPNSNTVVLTGKFAGTIDLGGGPITYSPSALSDSFIVAYNAADGAHSWSRGLARDPALVHVTSAGGDVVVVSSFHGTASLGGGALVATGTASDIFLVRYRSSDGAHVWSRRYGRASTETVNAIGSDGTSLYVAGRFSDTSNLGGDNITADGSFDDAFIAKYSAADGAHTWSRHFGGRTGHDEARAIAVTPTKIAVAISFRGEVNIGSQSLTATNSGGGLNPAAYADMLVARLDPATGAPLIASRFGSIDTDEQLSITYAGDRLASVGTFQQSINVFGVHLSGIGSTDIATFLVDY